MDEEKLAYQVYTSLGEIYPDLRPFQNQLKPGIRHSAWLMIRNKRSLDWTTSVNSSISIGFSRKYF